MNKHTQGPWCYTPLHRYSGPSTDTYVNLWPTRNYIPIFCPNTLKVHSIIFN